MGNSISITPNIGFNFKQHRNKAQSEIEALRQQLKRLQAWPEAGDQFLDLLPPVRHHAAPLTEADKECVADVVEDVIRGIDIGSRYPSFFHNLVTNSHLRQIFLDELERKLS